MLIFNTDSSSVPASMFEYMYGVKGKVIYRQFNKLRFEDNIRCSEGYYNYKDLATVNKSTEEYHNRFHKLGLEVSR